VCGSGVGAAVVTSLARYTLRAAAVHDPDPVAVLTELNAALHRERLEPAHRFCSVVFGVLAPTTEGCEVVLASGGHPPPVLLRGDGTAAFQHIEGGQVVGLLPNAAFASATVHLDRGDTLLLYAGLTEARIDGHRRYDEEALHSFLVALAPATAPGAIVAVRTLLAGFGDGLDDDTAVLAISVTPGGRHALTQSP